MALGGLARGISRLPWERLGAALGRSANPSITSRGIGSANPTAFHSYDVGAPQRISFGVEPQFNPAHLQVTPVARNPFQTSNINPVSREGEQLADMYERAIRGYEGPATDIDALLYWAGRGNREAMETIANLSARGPASSVARPISTLGRDMNDIFITHSTRYRPEMRGGDAFIRPTGDVNPDFPWRHTVHFAGQDRVSPVVGMGKMNSWDDAPYTVAARLNDVLEANPRALNNLMIDDIFMTPRFNQPLRIPNAKVIEGTGSDAILGVQDYARSIGARSYDDAQSALMNFANRNNVRYAQDFESPAWRYGMEGYGSGGMVRGGNPWNASSGAEFFSEMSPNLRERVFGQGRLSGMYEYYNPYYDLMSF
jgi:hypothetical protein